MKIDPMQFRRWTLFAIALSCSGASLAATGGGGGLEWEAPLQTITDSFTGPVAFGASTIAVVLSLATLAFADNLSGAGRQLVYLVLIIAALIGVVNLLTTLFGAGAVLTSSPVLMFWLSAVVVLGAGVAFACLQVLLWRALRRPRLAARPAVV